MREFRPFRSYVMSELNELGSRDLDQLYIDIKINIRALGFELNEHMSQDLYNEIKLQLKIFEEVTKVFRN